MACNVYLVELRDTGIKFSFISLLDLNTVIFFFNISKCYLGTVKYSTFMEFRHKGRHTPLKYENLYFYIVLMGILP